VVELKRGTVSVKTLNQLKRYLEPVQKRYPNHLVIGYLAGRRCQDWPILRAALTNERIKVLIMGQEIPRVRELRTCEHCRAGFHYRHQICPYCKAKAE
jgi:RecB family endonuclease NucS